jgi:hypothetical protein
MTTRIVRFKEAVPTSLGDVGTPTGVVMLKPTRRRDVADTVVLPAAFGVSFGAALMDGETIVKAATPGVAWARCEITDGTWGWEFFEHTRDGSSGCFLLPAGPDDVPLTELELVDPDTFDPIVEPGSAWQAALDAAVDAAVAGLVAGAPGALDTLNELAAALGDDANFSATVAAALATKVETVAGLSGTTITAASLKTALNLPADTANGLADEATVRAAEDLALQTDIDAEILIRDAANTDQTTITRLDRQSIEAARVGAGKAIAEYGDSVEVTETWADQAGVNAAANGQVVANRWYADNNTAPGGFTKAISVPATGRWRLQTLMYHKAGGAASFYFGVDCGTSGHALAANDPDTIVIGISNANARNKVMGANLTGGGVTNEAATTLGSNPTVDRTYLVTIDADDIWLTLTMKAVGVIGDLHSWRVRRSQLAAAGKTVNNIYVYLTDARGSAGSGLGPFILSTGTLQPTRTKTLASQTIEGAEFRIRNTSQDAAGVQWLYALPKAYDPRKPSPVVLWAHQSLTGAAVDPWEESRVQPVTQALLDAGFIVAAVSTTDNYGNETETDLYLELYKHLRGNFNTGPLFWYGASMGALTMFNAISHREWPTPAAAAAVGGAYDLRDVYDLPAYTAAVQAAYGIAGDGSDYDAKTAGYDPILRDGSDFRGVPVRLYTSADDTVQPPAGSEAFADLVEPYAPEAAVVYGSGAHLDASQYQAADVVSFFTRYL